MSTETPAQETEPVSGFWRLVPEPSLDVVRRWGYMLSDASQSRQTAAVQDWASEPKPSPLKGATYSAKPVAAAIRDAGGELYDYDRIPHEVVVAAREWAQANA